MPAATRYVWTLETAESLPCSCEPQSHEAVHATIVTLQWNSTFNGEHVEVHSTSGKRQHCTTSPLTSLLRGLDVIWQARISSQLPAHLCILFAWGGIPQRKISSLSLWGWDLGSSGMRTAVVQVDRHSQESLREEIVADSAGAVRVCGGEGEVEETLEEHGNWRELTVETSRGAWEWASDWVKPPNPSCAVVFQNLRWPAGMLHRPIQIRCYSDTSLVPLHQSILWSLQPAVSAQLSEPGYSPTASSFEKAQVHAFALCMSGSLCRNPARTCLSMTIPWQADGNAAQTWISTAHGHVGPQRSALQRLFGCRQTACDDEAPGSFLPTGHWQGEA